jgi:uncharacterized protein YebE (UPF0316 family)
VSFFIGLPFWATFLVVFFARAVDVALGTMRTISVVNGRLRLAVALAFFEVMLWGVAVGELITRLRDQPWLLFAFAGGVAAGSATGITIERRLALGTCVVRIIASAKGQEIAERLRELGQGVTTFQGEGRDGPRTLIYAHCPRRDLRSLLEAARAIEPNVFHAVEPASASSSSNRPPLASSSTGWRGLLA